MNPDWSKLTDPTRSELATMVMVVEFFDENVDTYEQCCGSGSARILNFCLDPDPVLDLDTAKSERAYKQKF